MCPRCCPQPIFEIGRIFKRFLIEKFRFAEKMLETTDSDNKTEQFKKEMRGRGDA